MAGHIQKTECVPPGDIRKECRKIKMEYTPITGPGSVSRISTYEKCPHKAFLKYKAELPEFKVGGKPKLGALRL